MNHSPVTSLEISSRDSRVPVWHAGFLRLVPVIRRQARVIFRRLAPSERDEAVAEVIAVALVEYLRALEAGVAGLVDGNVLAASAARSIRQGGRASGQENCRDVLSPIAQRRRGFTVESLKRSCHCDGLRARIDLRADGQALVRPLASNVHSEANASQANLSVTLLRSRARCRAAEKRLARHATEFQLARRIQEKLLPPATLILPGADIGGVVYPAEATGGDYFDYFPMLHRAVGVVVGDVSGHGFGPALLIASTRAYLRAFAQTNNDLGQLLELTDRALIADTGGEQFVTLILVRLDLGNRSLSYANAGHPTGYILNVAGQVRRYLASTGVPLGIGSPASLEESPVIRLRAGDLVLLHSDGVTEAKAPDGTAFGPLRAVSIVRAYRHDPAVRIAANLYHAVRAFAQNAPQHDDITVVVIKVGPDTEASPRATKLG